MNGRIQTRLGAHCACIGGGQVLIWRVRGRVLPSAEASVASAGHLRRAWGRRGALSMPSRAATQ